MKKVVLVMALLVAFSANAADVVINTTEGGGWVSVETTDGKHEYLATDKTISEVHAKADANSENIAFVDKKNENYNKKEIAARKAADDKLEEKKLDKTVFTDYSKRQTQVTNALDSRTTKLEAGLRELGNQTKQLRKHNAKGISGVAAIAAIPTSDKVGKLNIGLGVGSYDGEQVMAFGGSYRPSENFAVKMSASIAGSESSVYSVGVGYTFD